MKSIRGQGFRFLIVGGVNTLATYLIYLAALEFTGYRVAFSLAFLAGIFIAYTLNSVLVFKVSFSLRRMLQYPLVYAFQYLVGLLLLSLLVDYFDLDPRLAPLLNVILLMPLTFLLNRWFLVAKAAQ